MPLPATKVCHSLHTQDPHIVIIFIQLWIPTVTSGCKHSRILDTPQKVKYVQGIVTHDLKDIGFISGISFIRLEYQYTDAVKKQFSKLLSVTAGPFCTPHQLIKTKPVWWPCWGMNYSVILITFKWKVTITKWEVEFK